MVYKVPYKYFKDESKDPFFSSYNGYFLLRLKFFPVFVTLIGIGIFVWQVVFPFVYIKGEKFDSKIVKESVLGTKAGFGDFTFEELRSFGPPKDTFLSGNEYLKDDKKEKYKNVPAYFYLSIPKLDIQKALVETNAKDLDPNDALGHYPKSALPGEAGNVFIFGHSVLPIFYNPKNYKSIFSTLDKLQPGDEIIINYNNLDYVYLVEGRKILKPSEVDPLAEIKPRYLNEQTVTLMTCYPFGSKTLRYLVWGVLQR